MDYTVGLNPTLITKIQAVLAAMAAQGHPMKICQGLRTADYQHGLWLQGRDPLHPGKIITNCDGYTIKSNHQAAADGTGHAVDCCFQGSDPFGVKQPWQLYGNLVEDQELKWGGRFRLVDLDHAELA